jgi:(S)-2-hydroxy-acid oxidase
VPATLDVLPECVAAAQGRIRIHVDGGIRTGTDMFKALALGAECCWVGRPALWGLAVSYTDGLSWHCTVTDMIAVRRSEGRGADA